MVARVFSAVLFMLLLCGCYHVLHGCYAILSGIRVFWQVSILLLGSPE